MTSIALILLAVLGVTVPPLFVPKTCLLEREQLRSRIDTVNSLQARIREKSMRSSEFEVDVVAGRASAGCPRVREELASRQRYVEALQAQLLQLEMDAHRKKAAHKQNLAQAQPVPPFATDAEMIVFVLTTRRNFEVRVAIRETWASDHSNVFFVVGEACSVPPPDRPHQHGLLPLAWPCRRSQRSIDSRAKDRWERDVVEWNKTLVADAAKLLSEQEFHHDIVELPVDDGYAGLPDKVKHMYRWGIRRTQSQWFAKVDDDCVVRVGTLAKHLAEKYSSKYPQVIGHIVNTAPVQRSGKWKEHDHVDLQYYPPYPHGAAYIVSRPVAQYIADHSNSLHSYQGEDVSIGMWLAEASMNVQWNNSRHMQWEGGDCFDKTQFTVGHRITADKMKRCYRAADEVTSAQLNQPNSVKSHFERTERKGLKALAKWLMTG
eukprot:COSAG05_NODE_17_length_35518_cov_34.728084_36_plen_433_part_00